MEATNLSDTSFLIPSCPTWRLTSCIDEYDHDAMKPLSETYVPYHLEDITRHMLEPTVADVLGVQQHSLLCFAPCLHVAEVASAADVAHSSELAHAAAMAPVAVAACCLESESVSWPVSSTKQESAKEQEFFPASLERMRRSSFVKGSIVPRKLMSPT